MGTGCCYSRRIDIEQQIISGEQVLGFWNIDVHAAYRALRDIAEGDTITETDLQKYINHLQVNFNYLFYCCNTAKQWYQVANGQNEFDIKRIALLTILVSQGTYHDRASIVFDIFKSRNALYESDLHQILEDLFHIWVDQLPNLGIGNEKNGMAVPADIHEYQRKLHKCKNGAHACIRLLLLQGQVCITKEDFINKIEQNEINCEFLSSSGYRKFVRTFGFSSLK